jgi:hypothetical protein
MQEHPVPQNITSYEFHLIGNMTLKQFLELAAGGVLAFVAYSSNLPGILKWPLIFALVGVGIAMAFVPIEERPLDTWFLAFIRAIYNPTKFNWKKTIRVPDIFGYSTKQITTAPDDTTLTKPQRDSRIAAYFQSIAGDAQSADQEDLMRQASAITQMYDSVPAAKDVSPAQRKQPEVDLEKPSVTARVHQLKSPGKAGLSGTINLANIRKAPVEETIVLPTVIASQNLVERAPVSVMDKGVAPLNVAAVATEEERSHSPAKNTQQYRSAQAVLQQVEQDLNAVQTSTTLPFPKTPTQPNVVVGMVLDRDGKILENAIVEIRTIQGFPARALKSNRLGQFFASTPLPAGEYEIVVEKNGYEFNQEKLVINNKVVSPLEIRAN